ncbi:hypothetical protein [Sulfitobacter donghicola]|uniref:Uncharacterized protein n=1 Tax=Sulfitobacter donghicola DSW-25 = KCTC 12864 = JCM 14565 TaxID=1300350 RepID=A0A073IL72_9RHOB|nr:hypothetical protein [Sulfitobacter donghicola]KEJ90340.1 hypothetical protein DSW25_08620 [Sulfitobacter donghicola DSW-25 = KCTC 12864 = JCM 14565]KIN66584.1 hypothetical protein Z948_284 [Sulfitobacter donghicola DSW-25 = KCTC 12864 = JCM 14565]
MAYILTAIMTGGVAALLSLFTGGSFGEILWNYVLFGHLGMAALATAAVMSAAMNNSKQS